jgi:delta 1-pyrroline-5-carboxylate dehydrogenase
MASPRMTDVELEMFTRQRRENRRAIIALIGLVGGLSGLAVLLASMSRSGHDEDRPSARSSEHSSVSTTATSKPAAPAAVAPTPTSPPPAAASVDDVRRALKEQKESSVIACIEHAGKRTAQKEKVTVKLDLKAPDRIAKVEVTATPKSSKIVSCVKSEMKGLVFPRLASNMTVSVPFKLATAHGRRPSR